MFTDREREIYKAPDGRSFDPLRVERHLRLASGGQPRFNSWLDDLEHHRRLVGRDNVPPDDLLKADVAAAQAEEGLVQAARAALAFDKSTLDALVLTALFDFLSWLEKKESPVVNWPTSPPGTDQSASFSPPTPPPVRNTKFMSRSR